MNKGANSIAAPTIAGAYPGYGAVTPMAVNRPGITMTALKQSIHPATVTVRHVTVATYAAGVDRLSSISFTAIGARAITAGTKVYITPAGS